MRRLPHNISSRFPNSASTYFLLRCVPGCPDSTPRQIAVQSRGGRCSPEKGVPEMITVLLVILVLMAIGAFPSWGHSRSWGYYPSGGLGLVVLVLLILLLLGRV